ncbi:MAG: leucine-rich repeat protein [Oscillospiraceae bacterium]|nr:leucine-rich repeat protein [Oscillospiraceae bacterium]
MKKRILSILLAVLMLLSALPLGMVDTAYAAALASGKCGDSATWTLDSTGTLTISGTGATYNYDMDDDGNSAAPWCTKARIQRVNKVVVNSGITELGYSMFSNCTQLTSVSLPSGLKRIGSCLFLGCIRLSAITIPSSVTTIESNAFTHCDSIAAITLPSGLRTMGDAVCSQMAKLTTATVSGGVTYLSNYAFNDCPSLKTITLPNTVKSIGICAFRYDTALKDVYFNGSVTQWTSIQIAGEGNSALYNADVHCTGLSAPTVTGGNDAQGRPTLKWNAVTGAAKYEVYRARSMDGDYIKYSTVTSTSYTNISYIENGNTYYYKVRALDANGTAGAWSSIVSVTYRAASTGTLSAPTVTGGNDAQGRPTLKWNAVSGAAKYEVYRARSRSGEYIKYSTVTGTSYTNTSYIEDGNTYYYKVRALDANGTAGAWSSVVSVTYRKPAAATVASGKCGDSAKWTLDAAGTLTISGTGATYDFFNDYNCTAPWYDAELRLQIKKAVVNKGITYVGTYAFRDCAELTSVSLPAGLEEMGSSVFRYCESLTSITIPAGVTSIGGDFFYGCASLKSVTLPDSLWDAGGCTFMDCASLTSVRLPANLRDIAWWMFKDCTSLTSVTIPRGTVEVKKEAFDGCTSLKNVTFTGSAADWKGVTIRPGNTALTSAAIKCTGSTVLTAPTLTLSVSKKGQPTLKWSAVSGAAGYQLWCSYDGGDDCDPCYRWYANNDKTATSYTVPADYLEKGRTYTYKVRAVTSSGAVGSFSKEVTFTYNPAASLAAPTVTAGLDDQGYPALTWPAVPDAAQYEVYRAASEVTLGDSLFQECENLTDVTLPADLTVIGPSMFENCGSLKNVTIPSGVTHIGNAAFAACEALPEIRLPDGMEALGSEAFVGCRAVTKVYIPRSLTSIGEAAFRICRSLTDVYYGGTAAEWAAISVADRNDPLLNAALHCTGQSASRLDVPAMTLGEDCSDGKPTVWWPAVTGAERYEIWRAQAASDGSAPAASAYTLIVSADVTFHKDTTAEADTWYYYKVRAVSGSTYSDFSQAARRYCEAPPTMDTPEITSLELDDSGKPVLTWRTVEGAARYQVFRSEDNGFSYSPMGTVLPTGSDTITWTDTTAVSGTGYYYGVGCYDDNGHYSSFGGGEWWVTAR